MRDQSVLDALQRVARGEPVDDVAQSLGLQVESAPGVVDASRHVSPASPAASEPPELAAAFVLDASRRVLSASGPLLRDFGRTANEAQGEMVDAALPPALREAVSLLCALAQARGYHEASIPDGPIQYRVRLRSNAGGELTLAIVAQRRDGGPLPPPLATQQADFQTVVEALPVLVFGIAYDGTICYANHRAQQMTGYPARELTGQAEAWARLFPSPAVRSELLRRWRSADLRERSWRGEITTAEGERIPVLWQRSSAEAFVPGWAGCLAGLPLEDGLESPQAAGPDRSGLRSQLDQASVGYFRVGASGLFEEVNAVFAGMLGYAPPAALLGRHFSAIHAESEAGEAHRRFEQVLSGHAPPVREWALRSRSGAPVWVLVSACPLVADGRVEGYAAFAVDSTDQHQTSALLERQRLLLAEVNADLQERNNDLDQFAHMASHDLQEPLRKIQQYVSFVRDGLREPISERLDGDLQAIITAARRMHAQVRGLLTFAGSARKDLDAENVSLDECLREALDALSVAIEDEQGRMVWRDGPLPEARGDRVLLVQVFQNLVSNALRYRREEPPVVTVSWERRAGWLRVCVDDNGRGVDPARAEEVFMPFRRAREHGKQGTGLGLAIARRAIGRHGGRIWVEAKAEPGSRFVFTLPESGAAEGAAAGPSEAPRLSMGLQRELEP